VENKMKKLLNEIIEVVDNGVENLKNVSSYNRERMFNQILVEIRATCRGAIAVMEENEKDFCNCGLFSCPDCKGKKR